MARFLTVAKFKELPRAQRNKNHPNLQNEFNYSSIK